ncbi:MAG: sigma-54-dependent transcriptional regulator [Candidatus Sumerlaeia bacterium]
MSENKQYPGARVLVADDKEDVLNLVEMSLSMLGVDMTLAHDGQEALEALQEEAFDLVISDQFMPGATGMEVLAASRKITPAPLFILMTAQGTIKMAVNAMHEGAFHFIEKPFEMDLFMERVCMALDTINLAVENRNLRHALESRYVFTEILGTSKLLMQAVDMALRASEQNSPVLLLGESGTGKDLFARAIHFHSPRSSKPFIPINCGAIPESLIESEFFGHAKGAFTGAVSRRRGCFEEADGGTLFLDEIGEMPLDMQVKLLRVLEEHKIRRIGENREIPVDFRIIAATNRPLRELVEQGGFRQDLFYRLNVLTVNLPPLRERPEDVVPLAEDFIKKSNKKNESQVRSISPEAMEILQAYEFPGNVRELLNILQRAILLCDAQRLEPQHLPADVKGERGGESGIVEDTMDLKKATQKAQKIVERRLIAKALRETEGNHKLAAKLLGISRGSLYNKINDLGIEH